eukprot:969251-Pelagomonas_calceolata.AAC.5
MVLPKVKAVNWGAHIFREHAKTGKFRPQVTPSGSLPPPLRPGGCGGRHAPQHAGHSKHIVAAKPNKSERLQLTTPAPP